MKDIQNAAALLNELDPKTYDFRVEEHPGLNLSSKSQMRLIAQEVEKVLPAIVEEVKLPATHHADGSVITPSEKLKAVRYDALIPLLIAGHKEQQAVLEDKQAQIDELQDRLDRLEELLLGDAGTARLNEGVSGSATQSLAISPNPFSERTTITYVVDCACRVRLEVTTTDGKPVITLLDEQRAEGRYTFDWNTASIAPGMRICTLLVDGKPTVRLAMKVSR